MRTLNTKDDGAVRGSAPLRARSATANGLQTSRVLHAVRRRQPKECGTTRTCTSRHVLSVARTGRHDAREAHNPEVTGSNPVRATRRSRRVMDLRLLSRAHEVAPSRPKVQTDQERRKASAW